MLDTPAGCRLWRRIGWIAAAVVPMCAAIARSDAVDKPLFTFVQWNDAHVEVAAPPWFRLANEKMDYLATSLNAETRFPVPDFVIGVGDMINGRTLNELGPDFALLKTKLASLKCPFYPAMGNHENCQQEGNPQHEAPYRNVFGNDRTDYTFRQGGVEFVMLNDTGAPPSNQTAAGQARREWLRGVLDASPNVPKILCTHIPLAPVREEATMAKVWSEQWPGDTSYIAHDADMLQLVREHSSDIVAVLSGHDHLTGVAEFDGITQVVVSGTAGYPCDYAYYQVFSDRIHVQMYSLPQNLLTPETDCWKDATDSAHPTHDLYVTGNVSERSFDIALRTPLHTPEPSVCTLTTTGLIGLGIRAAIHRCRRIRPKSVQDRGSTPTLDSSQTTPFQRIVASLASTSSP